MSIYNYLCFRSPRYSDSLSTGKRHERPLLQLNQKKPNLDEVTSQKLIVFHTIKSILLSRPFISIVLGGVGITGLIVSINTIDWVQLKNLSQLEIYLKIVSLGENIIKLGLVLFVLWSSFKTFEVMGKGEKPSPFLMNILLSAIAVNLVEQFFDYYRSLI
ncbi:MAG: hypothetical protein AAGF26_17440 [Cyanobacteria bacterium P01_G01_bin.49]